MIEKKQFYFNHKPLERCIICGNDFIKTTDQKTCSDKCFDLYNQSINHNKYVKYKQ